MIGLLVRQLLCLYVLGMPSGTSLPVPCLARWLDCWDMRDILHGDMHAAEADRHTLFHICTPYSYPG